MGWMQIAQVIVGFAALAGLLWGVWTYYQRGKVERSKWMKELWEKFYEHSELKKIRDLLDGGDPAEISDLVRKEPSSFTDYLNFFEFVGCLHKWGQISLGEVRDMFDYYLGNLKQNKPVAEYIADPQKGFEKLQSLLKKIEEAGGK
jgi:hypothetical protein